MYTTLISIPLFQINLENTSMEFVNTDLVKVTLDVTTNLFFSLTHAFKTLDNKQELRKQAWIGRRRNVHCNLTKQLLWHIFKLFTICQFVQQVATQKTLKGKIYDSFSVYSIDIRCVYIIL